MTSWITSSLYYVVRNFGSGALDVAACLAPLLNNEHAKTAVRYLEEDFATTEDIRPMRTAEFMGGGADENTQADAVAFVAQLISEARRLREQGQ